MQNVKISGQTPLGRIWLKHITASTTCSFSTCVGELTSMIQLQSRPYYPTKSNIVLDVKCMNSTMSTDLILNHHQEGRML